MSVRPNSPGWPAGVPMKGLRNKVIPMSITIPIATIHEFLLFISPINDISYH